MRDYKGAVRDFDTAIRILPGFERTYNDRGHCKIFLKDYDGAIVDFNKAIDLKPDYAMAYMGRGHAEKQIQLYDAALKDFDNAVRLDPTLKKLYNSHINSSKELKKLKGFCFIRMENRNGVYYIIAYIDGVETELIFDTGASTVSLSAPEAAYLRRKGLLTDDDKRGSQNMSDATGKVTNEEVVNLKTVKLGCKELTNVKAVIVPSLNAPFLMGQTALSQFGKISIDYKNLRIIFRN
jgi:aspartyl protease family protein